MKEQRAKMNRGQIVLAHFAEERSRVKEQRDFFKYYGYYKSYKCYTTSNGNIRRQNITPIAPIIHITLINLLS